jgi:hypothetical protein
VPLPDVFGDAGIPGIRGSGKPITLYNFAVDIEPDKVQRRPRKLAEAHPYAEAAEKLADVAELLRQPGSPFLSPVVRVGFKGRNVKNKRHD